MMGFSFGIVLIDDIGIEGVFVADPNFQKIIIKDDGMMMGIKS
jgi:hypothetical protein